MGTADPRFDITDVLELAYLGLSEGEKREAHALVVERAEHLARVRGGIVTLRVVVERPQRAQSMGNPWRVRVRVTTPGHVECVAVSEPGDHEMHATLRQVVKDTFRAVERQLRSEHDRQRRDVKHSAWGPSVEVRVGIVVRVDHGLGYGFLRTTDGREVYFHENAVLHGDFRKIEPGAQVRFEDEEGDDGPQATTVQVMDMHGRRLDSGTGDPEGWRRASR